MERSADAFGSGAHAGGPGSSNVPVMRQRAHGTPTIARSLRSMRKNAQKDRSQQQDDDLWTWAIIGLISGSVTVALYGPLVWQATHSSL